MGVDKCLVFYFYHCSTKNCKKVETLKKKILKISNFKDHSSRHKGINRRRTISFWSRKLILSIYFNFIYLNVFSAYEHLQHVCAVPMETERGYQIPQN